MGYVFGTAIEDFVWTEDGSYRGLILRAVMTLIVVTEHELYCYSSATNPRQRWSQTEPE